MILIEFLILITIKKKFIAETKIEYEKLGIADKMTFDQYFQYTINFKLYEKFGVIYDRINKSFVIPISISNESLFNKNFETTINAAASPYVDVDTEVDLKDYLTETGKKIFPRNLRIVFSKNLKTEYGSFDGKNKITISANNPNWRYTLAHELYHAVNTGKFGLSFSMTSKKFINHFTEDELKKIFKIMKKEGLTNEESYETDKFRHQLYSLQYGEILAGSPTKQSIVFSTLTTPNGFIITKVGDVFTVEGTGVFKKHKISKRLFF